MLIVESNMSENGISKSVYFAQTRDIKEGNSIPKLQSSSEFLSLGPDTSEIIYIYVSAVCHYYQGHFEIAVCF